MNRRPSRGGLAARLMVLTAAAITLPAAATAQDPAPAPSATPPDSTVTPGVPPAPAAEDRYAVYLVTMDQGDEVWELFGHNAILIRDRVTGQDLVWNWGLFNFGDVDFVPRLLQGTMRYSMGPSELGAFLDAYRRANRSVYANELHLTGTEARELDELVRLNYLPENREYIYDYYRDNCSTRVRDALDRVLDGALRERFASVPTPRSYRWHSRRLVQRTTWVDQGLSHMIGSRADRPITEWEEMFLPLEMLRLLEDYERPNGAGGTRPLLGPREVLYDAGRPELPAGPPPLSPVWPLLGLAAAGLIAGLAARAGERSWARVGLWGAIGAWGVFSGILGLLLVLVWFTDHVFAQWNVNIFYTSPLALLLALAAPIAIARRGVARPELGRWVAGVAFLIAAASLLMALVEATPLVGQGNGEVVAVALPINLAVAWALAQRFAQRSGVAPGSSPASAQQ